MSLYFVICNITTQKNHQMFEYGGFDEILKLFYSVNVRDLLPILQQTLNLLNHLVINPEYKLVILEKFDEFMIVSKLEELFNHPNHDISYYAFAILSLL